MSEAASNYRKSRITRITALAEDKVTYSV